MTIYIYTCKQALEIRLERPVFAPLEHLLASHITSTSIIFCESDSSGDSSDATSTYCTDSSITLAHLSGDCGRKSMCWASWTLSHAIQAQGHMTKQKVKDGQRESQTQMDNTPTDLQDNAIQWIHSPVLVCQKSFQQVSTPRLKGQPHLQTLHCTLISTCVQHVFNMFSACFPCCLLAASCTASFTLQVVKFKNPTLAGAIRIWEQHLKTAQIAHPWQIRITMT